MYFGGFMGIHGHPSIDKSLLNRNTAKVTTLFPKLHFLNQQRLLLLTNNKFLKIFSLQSISTCCRNIWHECCISPATFCFLLRSTQDYNFNHRFTPPPIPLSLPIPYTGYSTQLEYSFLPSCPYVHFNNAVHN